MRILHRLRHCTAQRTALLGLLLLLVGWQDFAAQSHVHLRAEGGTSLAGITGQRSDQGKHAPSQSRGDCSLCQVLLGGVAPILRTAVLLLAPILSLLVLLPATRRVAFQSAISHDWQSRGPPLI